MTQRQWLARERRPEYSGINARAALRACCVPNGAPIHQRVNLRALMCAIDRFAEALRSSR